MLASLLPAGIVAAPLGSAGLFVPARRFARTAGFWPALRRLVLAMAGTLPLAMAVAGALHFLGTSAHHLEGSVAGIVAASLIWVPATRRWTARALRATSRPTW